MYDITYSIHMTSYPLYLWRHIHSVWQHNTVCCWHPTHHMCDDVTCKCDMTSHPLYQTSHPLYLSHHKLSTDLIPAFVWHRILYMCDIICILYRIISTPYVTTLLYLWHHSLYIWNHIQYVGPHTHYACDITARNQCHDSRSIENITLTLYDITLG